MTFEKWDDTKHEYVCDCDIDAGVVRGKCGNCKCPEGKVWELNDHHGKCVETTTETK